MLKRKLALSVTILMALSLTLSNISNSNSAIKAFAKPGGKVDVKGSDKERTNDKGDEWIKSPKENPFKAKKHNDKEKASVLQVKVSNELVSMTEAKVIDLEVDFGYKPDLTKLNWTFGGKAFSEWKKWDKNAKAYSGAPIITFEQEPYLDGNKVKAKIKFDLVYGTVDLSPRSIRVLYPALLGTYDLTVKDSSNSKTAVKPIKYNVYDSYHTYDELKPAVDDIFAKAKKDRYLDYQVIGKSAEGRSFHFIVLAKDKQSVNNYLNKTVPTMLENPASLQKKIDNGTIGDYKVPIFINNIHPDEAPGVDAQLDFLRMLTTQDSINYRTDESNPDASVTLNVKELLDHVIFLFDLTENPDGRYYNTRQNANGFDVNRDNGYQTQIESRVVVQQIAKWNPLSFLDLHGFVKDFLIEPCTPPHDPNYEYDLLINNMMEQANLMGQAGAANTKYDGYIIPYEDYGYGWDDGAPAYTATYAMHHGAMGHTIEIPELNQDSVNGFVYAMLASSKYVMSNKDKLFRNQLEYYRRGVEGIDSAEVDKWLINAEGQSIGRPRENGKNFFPEYYVLPVDNKLQKNAPGIYDTVEYLLRNGVKVEQTNKDVTVGGVKYPKGTYVVNMHQAKRGYANMVLYKGYDASDFAEMYAEIVMNFPSLRGFNKYDIRTPGAFKGVTQSVNKVQRPVTNVVGASSQIVIRNTQNDAIKAVNKLLTSGKSVKMITADGGSYKKGDFIVSNTDLNTVKNSYLLDITSFDGKATAKTLVQPKVNVAGSADSKFVLKELGFNIVSDAADSNIIVDDYGYGDKTSIKAGKDYLGIGRYALDFAKSNILTSGFDWKRTGSYHEGLLKSDVTSSSLITSGYNKNEQMYVVDGSYIVSVPDTAKVLAEVTNTEDFYVAGWMPGHEAARDKVLAITQDIKGQDITLFANTLVNKAHPQNSYRLLANSIFVSTSDIE
jgi:murein tripeptide amidase MpaA